jgi:hypothetical protein
LDIDTISHLQSLRKLEVDDMIGEVWLFDSLIAADMFNDVETPPPWTGPVSGKVCLPITALPVSSGMTHVAVRPPAHLTDVKVPHQSRLAHTFRAGTERLNVTDAAN